MGYSTQESITLLNKVVAGVIDGAGIAAAQTQWYDTPPILNVTTVNSRNILTQYDSVPPATTLAIAQSNAAANPTIIQDLSVAANAARLYAVPGTGGTTYVVVKSTATNYGESNRLRHWISPNRAPQASGASSAGYTLKLYSGNPASGGTLIATSDSNTGTAPAVVPGWIFNYDQGLLILSQTFLTNHPSWIATSGMSNFYILGFRYIGNTLVETLASLGGGNQSEVDAIEAGIGLNSDGTYTAPTGTTYLSTSTSVINGLTLLDTAIAAKVSSSSLAPVATSGSYNDLTNKPIIPAAQVQSDWNATSGLGVILNKPTIPTVPTDVSYFYNDSGYQTAADVTLAISGKADVTYVDAKVSVLQDQINVLTNTDTNDSTTDAAAIAAAVLVETTNREAADAAISLQALAAQDAVTAETSARIAGDADTKAYLEGLITAEASVRAAADTALQTVNQNGGVVVQSLVFAVEKNGSFNVDAIDLNIYSGASWDIFLEAVDGRVRKFTVSGIHRTTDDKVRYTVYGIIGDTISHSVNASFNAADYTMVLLLQNHETSDIKVSVLRYPLKKV